MSPVREFRNVLRRMRNIQSLKFVPDSKEENPLRALAYVSCTRSSASSRFCVSQCAKLKSRPNNGRDSCSNDAVDERSADTHTRLNQGGGFLFPPGEMFFCRE